MKTSGEKQFEAYLGTHGYSWQYEPDYTSLFGETVAQAPDYLVGRNGHTAVVEVKQ